MAYATKAQVKSWLDLTSTADDDLLDDLIERAQAWIERYTNRVFEVAADTTKAFDAEADVEGNELWLVGDDLCQITSVTNGDGTTIAASQYVTEPRRSTPYYALRLKSSATVSWTYDDAPEDAISIEGRWGYSVTPPADVVQATVRLVAWMYRQRDTGVDADRPAVNEQGVMVFPASMPRDVAEMLRPYRRVL